MHEYLIRESTCSCAAANNLRMQRRKIDLRDLNCRNVEVKQSANQATYRNDGQETLSSHWKLVWAPEAGSLIRLCHDYFPVRMLINSHLVEQAQSNPEAIAKLHSLAQPFELG